MAAPNDVVKNNSVVLILSCLAREPMHGYRIAREIEKVSDGFFAMGEGTLYPHLHQLEQDGFVEGYWETVSGDRERRSYRITENGIAELAKRTRKWRQFEEKMNSVLNMTEAAATA